MNTTVTTLGPARFPSPITARRGLESPGSFYVPDAARIRHNIEIDSEVNLPDLLFEKAGPRERIYFDPAQTRAAIVTCGGLCPGLNNVIRSAFLELHHNYGVADVWGIRYGYQGLNPAVAEVPLKLEPELVDEIHEMGGTILGSSRGDQPKDKILDFLQARGIQILLTVGGDGTQRGAHEIWLEAQRRRYPLAVVGIPKTIDNDLLYVDRTFGFATAIDRARDVLNAAHAESKGYPNGAVLVRLMGRDSGFIAAAAALASGEVNFTLIPEVPFALDGPRGFLAALQQRLQTRQHAVIVVAEGAGQNLLAGAEAAGRDASGNALLKDIGLFLKDRIAAHFKTVGVPVSLKYMDPSYYIRSVPANSSDAILCDQYARFAVHAAMAGKTDMVVGRRNGFIHVPIPMATERRQKVDPDGFLWRGVLAITGQPAHFV